MTTTVSKDTQAGAPACRGVVYFDNAATSWPKPPEVGEAMARFLCEEAANPGRSGHRMAVAASDVVDRLRSALSDRLNAEGPHRIVLTGGCTASLNTAIHGLLEAACAPDSPFHQSVGADARPHVVSTMLEHKAAARPLAHLAERGLIDLHLVGCNSDGFIDAQEVLSATNERTIMVAITHASNALGTIQPVEAVAALLQDKRPEIVFLVDGAQTAGAMDIDVQALGADMFAFPAHKGYLGPTGVGALYVGPRAFPDQSGSCRMRTMFQGGTGGGTPTMKMPESLPRRFEPGTPNTVGMAGWLAALEHGPASAIEHERRCAGRIIQWAEASAGVRVVGTTDTSQRTGVVAVVAEAMAPADMARELDARHAIACRAGDLCATNSHIAMGTAPDGTLRFSAGPYTTDEDVDALLAAMEDVLGL